MLFNSLEYALFVPVVFLVYWLILKGDYKKQNLFLLFASYFFYACWDWRFLSLIILSSSVDYFTGIKIHESNDQSHRKKWLWLSILVNLGMLGFFKYFNFFIESFIDLSDLVGLSSNVSTLNIILPVGISFYTFQTLSYTIDIYRKRFKPTRSWVEFFTYVTFFPQLVAGPIERARNLLPQFQKPRIFNKSQAIDGLRQILWGLFKKMVIADRAAYMVNEIYAQYTELSGLVLVLGMFLFFIQLYGDFSGYSDIAIGTARLFGFDLKLNFRYPFFSRNLLDGWQRWHISLTTWIRDYVGILLGGSRGKLSKRVWNTLIIFLVIGLWHGANWTYVFWGILQWIYLVPLILLRTKPYKNEPRLIDFPQMFLTFFLTSFSLIAFRSGTIKNALSYYTNMFDLKFESLQTMMINIDVAPIFCYLTFIYFFIMLTVEWINRRHDHGLKILPSILAVRWFFYLMLMLLIVDNATNRLDYIYFQF